MTATEPLVAPVPVIVKASPSAIVCGLLDVNVRPADAGAAMSAINRTMIPANAVVVFMVVHPEWVGGECRNRDLNDFCDRILPAPVRTIHNNSFFTNEIPGKFKFTKIDCLFI